MSTPLSPRSRFQTRFPQKEIGRGRWGWTVDACGRCFKIFSLIYYLGPGALDEWKRNELPVEPQLMSAQVFLFTMQ